MRPVVEGMGLLLGIELEQPSADDDFPLQHPSDVERLLQAPQSLTTIVTGKSEAFCVIEPLHDSFVR